MNDIELVEKTLHYFRPPQNYFWRWAENGQVVEWRNGTTICYREDLLPILKSLGEQGLPPLGTVLLLLAACRDDWKDTSGKATLVGILSHLNYFHEKDRELKGANRDIISGALKFTDLVSTLPRQYRTGKQRIQLIQSVSEYIPQKIEKEDAKSLIDEFNSGRMDHVVFKEEWSEILPLFWQDMENLNDALKHFPTKESLEVRIRTGLECLPEPLETEFPEQPPRDLLELLGEDHRTAGLARLTRRLAAALHIPMQTRGSSDQPYGGVSDISNRGNFDRLLLSELAHDDLTLMARLANNEALFLRREELPSHLHQERVILLDTTLKMWGTPRVFALSAALACAQNNKTKAAISAYALSGNNFREVDLASPQGIVQALELMDPSVHCEKALASFLESRQKTGRTEFFFITGEQGWHGRIWEAGLSRLQQSTAYLITVDRGGEMRFYELAPGEGKGGRRLLNTTRFDLEELLFAPVRIIRKAGAMKKPPVFLEQKPSPLYFPTSRVRVHRRYTFDTKEKGVVSITLDQRVLYWPARDKGAIELIPFIEEGYYSFGFDSRDIISVMVYRKDGTLLRLYYYHIGNGHVQTHDLSGIDGINDVEEVLFMAHQPVICTKNEAIIMLNAAARKVMERKPLEQMHERLKGLRSHFEFDPGRIRRFINNGYSVLNNVKEIYVDDGGWLYLDNRQLRLYNPGSTFHHYQIRLWDIKEPGMKRKVPVSREIVAPEDHPNSLLRFTRFTWSDGSEALVDSRGLLHLRSSDKSIVEITLVLVVEKPVACWASDGHSCGSPYFTGTAGNLNVHEFYKTYLQPFINALV